MPRPDPCRICPPPPEARRPPLPAPPAGDLPPLFDEAAVHRVQAALIAHCEERGDRFALLDPPFGAAMPGPAGLSDIAAWRSRYDSASAALLWPWVRVPDPLAPDSLRALPPSGHVLGLAAALDLAVGVHRAPANAALAWAHGLTARAGIAGEEQLNLLAVNVLRAETGRGIRPMGARTLSSDQAARYVNVRRLVQLIRRGVTLLSQWVVFEPNDTATRAKYAAVLSGFLGALFARGAFAGATPAESFFVRCDDQTTTAADRDEGRLLALIGIAPAYPLEFIVLRVGRLGGALEIDEMPDPGRAAA